MDERKITENIMRNQSYVVFLAFTLLAPVPGLCQNEIKWGAPKEAAKEGVKPMRTPMEGMKTYYEPEAVKKDGGIVYFKMFNSYDPADKEAGVSYAVNCSTQEISSATGEGASVKWNAPERVLAGESMYAFGKKMCGWGPGFGSKIKSLFD
jgi:hypothetical protein